MESYKNKGLDRLVFLIVIVVLMAICHFANAQGVERITFNDNGRDIVKRFNSESISLKNPLIGNDILLNVFSDSVDAKSITFAIYIYFPENINPENKNLVIEYTDGTQDVFQQLRFEKDENYSEYEAINDINNISSKKVKSILIRGVAKYYNFNHSYFKDFFASL